MTAVPYRPEPPESQAVSLTFVDDEDHPVSIDRWEHYDFSGDMLTPSDSFSFTIGATEEGLPDTLRNALKLGAGVALQVDDCLLAVGYVDSVEISADARGGTVFAVNGRDKIGQTLDTVVDPAFQLPENGTVLDLLKKLFTPFGWSEDSQFEVDNAANRNARAGLRGTKLKPGKKKESKALREYKLHQTKPYNHESVFHFASRVTQRHGLWLWPSADGSKLIVSKPDFDQDAAFILHRGRDGTGNITSGSVKYDMTNHPAIIIADSFSGGGEFGKGRAKAYIISPILGLKDDGEPIAEVAALLKKYPSAVENTLPLASSAFRAPTVPFRPMFLHDEESKTQEQLNAFVKREMSLLYRKTVTCHYVVEGHGQIVNDAFVAWTPDMVVDVNDDVAGLAERMYVLGAHFSKSRNGGGTQTRLDLIRLNSIVF